MKSGVACVLLAFATPSVARAAVQVYCSEAAWTSATTNPTALTDFEESFWLHNTPLSGPQAHPGFTIEGFAGAPVPNIDIGLFGPPGVTSNVCVANGDENIDVTPQTARTAFAYDVFVNGLGPATITAYDAAGAVLGTTQAPTSYVGFLGLTSGTPIARVKFVSTEGALVDAGFDNVRTADRVPPECPGDFNGDGVVNTSDLTLLLARFGSSVTPGSAGDMNGDGVVTTPDLTAFLIRFGAACP